MSFLISLKRFFFNPTQNTDKHENIRNNALTFNDLFGMGSASKQSKLISKTFFVYFEEMDINSQVTHNCQKKKYRFLHLNL